MDVYLSFHSYSQLLLLPYGHTVEHLDNYEEMVLTFTIINIEFRYFH